MNIKTIEVSFNHDQLIELLEASNNNSSLWLDLTTISIAVIALVFSIYMGHIQRKHNKLSVSPRLNIRPHISENGFSLSIFNAGVGPAIITSIKFLLKGDESKVTSDPAIFLKDLLTRHDPTQKLAKDIKVSLKRPTSALHLKEGSEYFIFNIKHTINKEDINNFNVRMVECFKLYSMEIKYQSIYNDKVEHTLAIIE